jgi:hypothetical protein
MSASNLEVLPEAEKLFKEIDPLVDETLGLPVKSTMSGKQRPARPPSPASDLEWEVIKRSGLQNPKNIPVIAKKNFARLFENKKKKSPPGLSH